MADQPAPSQMIPFADVLKQYTPEQLEQFYPGITATGGYLKYVKGSPTGTQYIMAPAIPKAPAAPKAAHAKQAPAADSLQTLADMIKSTQEAMKPTKPIDLKAAVAADDTNE